MPLWTPYFHTIPDRLHPLGLVLGLAILAGCGVGRHASPSPTPLPLPAPFALSVSIGSTFDNLSLAWAPPSLPVDGYTLEVSVDGGPFSTLNTGLIDKTWTGARLTFNATTPEALTLRFRLGTIRNGVAAEYSTLANYVRGLYPIDALSTYQTSAGVSLTWLNQSKVADRILIERSPVDSPATPASWTVLPDLPAQQTTFLDQDLIEGPGYVYRITCHKGAYASTAATLPSGAIALSTITGLSAVPQSTGVLLTWTNRSTRGTAIALWRRPSQNTNYLQYEQVTVLDPTATSYLDPLSAPGLYSYYLETIIPSASAFSPIVSATFQAPGAGVFSLQSFQMPTAQWAFLSPQGTQALSFQDLGRSGLLMFDGTDWKPFFTNGTGLAEPMLRYDHLGRPHTVTYTTHSDSTVGLIHEWLEGSVWQQEPIPSSPLDPAVRNHSQVLFELDALGGVHVLVHQTLWNAPSSADTLRYLHKEGGTWTEEALEPLFPSRNVSRFTLALTPQGSPRVVIWGGPTLDGYELSRSTDGQWSQQHLEGTLRSYGTFIKLAYLDEQSAVLVFDQASGPITTFLDAELRCLEKRGGLWQAPYRLGTISINALWIGDISLSPDRSRVALTALSASGGNLYIFANDAWMCTALGQTFLFESGNPFLGFDTANKVALFGRDSVTQAPKTSYRLLKEAP